MIKLIIWLVACLLSTISLIVLFYKLSGKGSKITIKAILIFILGIVLQTIIKYYNLTSFSIISYFVFFPFLFYAIHPMKMKKLCFYVIIIWIYGMFLDLFCMLIISIIRQFVYFDIYGFIAEGCIVTAQFVLFMILAFNKKVKLFTDKLYSKFYGIIYSDLSLIIFSGFMLLVSVVIFMYLKHLNINVLLYLIFFLIVLVFIVLIKTKMNDIENKIYLDTLKDNNDFYIKMDDENRIFKHNLVAKLMSIKSVSNKKAALLIDDLIIKYNDNIKFSKNIKNVPYGLNGIIYQKLYPYNGEIDFKIHNKINSDIFEMLKPRRYNVLVEKLVVSLDNAIEACLISKNKIIVINLEDDENMIYIEIKNSFSHNIDLDNLGDKGYSTKGYRRGLGLFSILRNSEVSLKVKVINDYFVSNLSVKKNNKK